MSLLSLPRWYVATVVHNNMHTDDTYQFSAAVKSFRVVVGNLTEAEASSPYFAEVADV